MECREPFGHAAEPWTTWRILAGIEASAGNAIAAAQAHARAVACYLAYRRDGGENHYHDGRVSVAVTDALLAGDVVGATAIVDELFASPKLPGWMRPFISALKSIIAGSRDRSLADAPEMNDTSAAELLHIIDVLER